MSGNTYKGWDVVFDFFPQEKKSSNTLIVIGLVLLSQMKTKRNMIMFLIQKDNLLM